MEGRRMTDIIKCISDNKILFGCIFVVVIIAFAYKINDFVPLLKQALGTILQQICSLIIEAVVLVFKIINSLEIYIVLMIDALTGKATSEGKIASLAIGVLSVASFYTTYTGLKSFVSEYSISFLITLGIQAILLATSLRINIIVKLDNDNVTSNKRTLLLKCSIILFIISIVTAYILSIFRLSYASSTIIYHVIYMIAIVAVLALIVLAVIHLSETGTLNRNEGRILFVIYFAVLSVSSFFSYNAFISVLYPNQVRDIDTFRTYKLGTIALVENIDNDIDRDYYDNLYNTINLELQNIMTSDKTSILTDEEKDIYENREKYEQYLSIQHMINEQTDEEQKVKDEWTTFLKSWSEANTDIGVNAKAIWETEFNNHKSIIDSIDLKIENLKSQQNALGLGVSSNMNAYDEICQKLNDYDCTDSIKTVRNYMQNYDSASAYTIDKAVRELEEYRLALSQAEHIQMNNNLSEMIDVYFSYLNYQSLHRKCIDDILSIEVTGETYGDEYNRIPLPLYNLLQNLPRTDYEFYDFENQLIKTSSGAKSDYYSLEEKLRRNANPDLSQSEKNIRSFISNKPLAVMCAAMALLIDMMILFVGIILPKDIDLESTSAYSEQEVKRRLSNLFNKPIRR